MTSLARHADALEEIEEVASISPYHRRAFREVVNLLRGKRYLGTREAADRLGVSSINTVKRLAEDGFLSGAVRSEHGVWQIPLSAVVALEKDREKVRREFKSSTKGIKVSNKVSHRLPR
jgi:hypothetical protein